jgi:hypothetical protein
MTDPARECSEVRDRVLALASESAGWEVPFHAASHMLHCERCRTYAEGLRMAPSLYGAEPLYHPALKWRTLAAVSRPKSYADFRLALLLALPAALFLLVSFLAQVYVVDAALSRWIASNRLSWVLSLATIWALGAAAGGICLAASLRLRGHRSQEVSHD